MLTLTITLKSTTHQITLAYQSLTSLTAALNEINTTLTDNAIAARKYLVLHDDYGHSTQFDTNDIAFFGRTDQNRRADFHNEMALIKIRGENALKAAMGADPSLEFLVEGRGPKFGR